MWQQNKKRDGTRKTEVVWFHVGNAWTLHDCNVGGVTEICSFIRCWQQEKKWNAERATKKVRFETLVSCSSAQVSYVDLLYLGLCFDLILSTAGGLSTLPLPVLLSLVSCPAFLTVCLFPSVDPSGPSNVDNPVALCLCFISSEVTPRRFSKTSSIM